MVRYIDVFTELVKVEIELWNRLDAHLATTVGVTLSQFQALAAIQATGGPARVQDISIGMSITVGATSKLVDRLERDGLAVRSAHPNDRRSSIVALSERGVKALAAAEIAAESHLGRTLGAALPADRAALLLGELAVIHSQTETKVKA